MKDIDYDTMYRYLNGELEEAERAAYQDQLAADPELQAELRFNEGLLGSVDLAGDQQLQDHIQQAAIEAKAQGFTITDDQIIHYLNDELELEQSEIIHKRLQEDQAFAQEVAFQKDLLTGVEVSGDEDLMAQIKATHADLAEKGFFEVASRKSDQEKKSERAVGKVRRLFSVRSIAIAASFLLILAIGYFLFPSSNNFESVYASHYTSDQATLDDQLDQLSLVGMAIPDKARRESLKAALELFEAGEYTVATSALETHRSTFPEDETASYFLGLSLMEEGQFNKAVSTFATLAQKQDSVYQEKAQWYQALSYLRISKGKSQAISLLKDLSEKQDSEFQQAAQQILQEINPE